MVHPDDVEMVQSNLEAALDPVDPGGYGPGLRFETGETAATTRITSGMLDAVPDGAGEPITAFTNFRSMACWISACGQG
jgi:hypothetical protein